MLRPRATAPRLLAGLVLALLALPAAAQAAVSRPAAAKAALKALRVQSDRHAVRVFGLLSTVAPHTAIAESVPAGAVRVEPRTGVRIGSAARVLRTPAEPTWLFYADQGPHQGYAHPGRIALVGAHSGRVRLSRTVSWVPLVGGTLPAFLRSPAGYESNRFVIFDRPWATAASAARLAGLTTGATEAERRAAAALAAQHACVLRYSDTLGNFFDFGRVDQTRAGLGLFFARLSALDPGFVSTRYTARDGRTPAAAAQRLIDRSRCRDLTLYAAGAAARSGAPGVIIGVRARRGRVEWQTLDARSLLALIQTNRGVSFKLVFDAPYTGRLASALRNERNGAVELTSGGAGEPSFSWLPALLGPHGLVHNAANPRHLLEFSNALIGGLDQFTATPAEVDHGIAQRSTTFMAWMLARAVDLAGSPFGGHLTSPVEILPPTTPPTAGGNPDHVPSGHAIAVSTDEDTPVSFDLPGTDQDGDPLTFDIVTPPAHGTLTGTGPRVTYTPAADYNGADVFTYRVSSRNAHSAPYGVSITVRPVNDPPAIVLSPGQASYTEGSPPVAVDPALAVHDVDSTTLQSARVAITGGFDATHDTLAVTPQGGITGVWDPATGVLSLTGTASVADYQATLRSVTFETPGNTPSTALRSIAFSADDGAPLHHAGAPSVRDLAVVAVNQQPVLSTTSTGDAAYAEDGPATTIDPNIAIADPDSATMAGATVQIGTGFESTDRLDFTAQNGITGSYDTGTGTLTLTGAASQADYATALSSVQFHTVSDNPSEATRQIGMTVTDGSDSSNLLTRGLTVSRTNDAPVNVVPGAQTMDEDASLVFSGARLIAAGDPDAGAGPIEVTLGVGQGALTLSGTTGLTVTGDGTGAVDLTGSPADVNAALDGMTYAPAANFAGADTLTMTTDDLGHTGSGGAQSDTDTVGITVAAVDDAPVNSVPAAQSTGEDTPLTLSAGSAPSVSDIDAGSGSLEVTLSAVHGTLQLGGTSGLTVTGDGTSLVDATGTIADLNAALDGLSYTPDQNFNGADTITMVTSDLGNTGTGGPKSDTDTIGVTVAAVNDAPVNTLPATKTTKEDTPLVLSGGSAPSVADVDAGSSPVEVTLGVANGALTLNGTTGLTVTGDGTGSIDATGTVADLNAALDGLTYTTPQDFNGSDTLTFTTNDLGHSGSGGAKTDTATMGITITAVNDAPAVSLPAAQSVDEDSALTISPSPAVSDVDADPNLVSVTVSVDHGTLTLAGISGLSFVTGDGTADRTMTFLGQLFAVNNALDGLGYVPDANFNGADALALSISDLGHNGSGGAKTASGSTPITVRSVDDAPVVDTGSAATFSEVPSHDNSVQVAPLATVSDVDDTNLVGGTLTLTNRPDGAAESLTVDTTGTSITAAPYDAGTGAIALSGTDTVAHYQQVIRSLRYANTAAPPDAADRHIDVTVDDGQRTGTATATVHVSPIDAPPAIDLGGGTATFTEDTTPVVLAPSAAVSDADNATLTSGTVTLTNRPDGAAESLAADTTGTSIVADAYDSSTGVLHLHGSDTLAHYQQVLRTVAYDNSANAPDTTDRSVDFVVNDGIMDSAVQTVTVTVVPTNDPPVLDLNGGGAGTGATADWTEAAGPVTLAPAAVTSDPDNANLASARITLSNRPDGAAESLAVDTSGTSITAGAYDSATGVLQLTGSDTLAHYQQVLRTATYDSTSHNPSTADRNVVFKVNDGSADSPDATAAVTIHVVNDPPTVDMGGATPAFTETSLPQFAGSGPVLLGPGATVADVDNTTLSGATATLTNHPDGAAESLSADTTGTSITALSYDSSTGVLTLSGSDTVAHYQQVLRTVRYANSSNTPDPADRVVDVVVNDGTDPSAAAHVTVTVTPTNDQPTPGTDTFNGAKRAIGNTALVVDAPAGGTPDPAGPQKTVTGNILGNDSDPDGDPITLVAETVPTTGGGTVDILSTGDFTYHPAPGCATSDSFTYHVTDGNGGANGTGAGTVNLTSADCVWYVDGSQGTNGNGTSGGPFNTLAGAASSGGTGHTIFLYPGTYSGGLTLKNSQQLLSKRSGLSLPDGGSGSVQLEAPAASIDQINGGTVLAQDNTIQGVDFGTTSGPALSATTNVGTATVDTTAAGSIANGSGGAVDITGGGALNMQFASLSSTGGTFGIRLNNTTGTFSATAGAIQSAGVSLAGGTVGFTYGGTINNAGSLVSISGQTGGTKTFNGALTGASVALTNNTGATMKFGGGMALNSGGTDAFTATGGGTVGATGTNTISSGSGRALNVQNTSIDDSDLTFQSISSNTAATGIDVNNTTNANGRLVVTGNGGTCTSAGTCTGGAIQSSSGPGIKLTSVPGGASLTRMAVTNGGDDGIVATSVGTSAGSGLDVASSFISGNGNAVGERGLDWTEVHGTSSINSTTVTGSAEDNARVTDTTGTLGLTVSGSTFSSNSSTLGSDGLQLFGDGNSTMRAAITGSTFSANRDDGFQLATSGSTTTSMDLTFNNNTIHAGGNPGAVSAHAGLNFDSASNSTIRMAMSGGSVDGSDGSAIILNPAGSSHFDADVGSVTVGTATALSGSASGIGIWAKPAQNAVSKMRIHDNTIRNTAQYGMFLIDNDGTGSADFTVTGNTVSQIGSGVEALFVQSGSLSTDAITMCADIGGSSAALFNTLAGTASGGVTDVGLRRPTVAASSHLQLPGFAGSGSDAAAITSYIQSRNAGSPSVTNYSAPVETHAGGCQQPSAPVAP